PHVMNAKLVALKEAEKVDFQLYAARIVENARALASSFVSRGVSVATGGTDNHLLLLDVTPFGLNGRMAEQILRGCGITLNRNALPFDPNGPWYTSGLRLGSAAVTTLGMGEKEMDEIADIITTVLSNASPAVLTKGERAGEKSRNRAKAPKSVMEEAKARVQALLSSFPVYPEMDLEWLEKEFVSRD
ncbi:MAG: glycine hydroxymethyltransferase, partial [Candidatus Ornithospirochaeta sp.]